MALPEMLTTIRFLFAPASAEITASTVGQAQTLTVGVLAVLAVALVQAADEDDIIGIPGLFHGFSYQLFGSTVILQILSGHHPVVFTACIAHVATGIDHLGLAGHTLLDAVQRREFALHLRGRTTTAYGHHLDGILAHYKNLLARFKSIGSTLPLFCNSTMPSSPMRRAAS